MELKAKTTQHLRIERFHTIQIFVCFFRKSADLASRGAGVPLQALQRLAAGGGGKQASRVSPSLVRTTGGALKNAHPQGPPPKSRISPGWEEPGLCFVLTPQGFLMYNQG